MKLSVVMTLYNREHLVVMNTLAALARTGIGKDAELVVVNDGSTLDYSGVLGFAGDIPVKVVECDTAKDRPGTYVIGEGHNNPAHANNVGLAACEGDYVAWLSSDCMIQPHSFDRAFKRDLSQWVYFPSVIDIPTGEVWLGASRIAPFNWFFVTTRENVEAVGGWDENYLKGMAYEDNDFTARLAQRVGRLVVDLDTMCFHQHHEQTAYSDGLKGCETNKAYTGEKWGGIPWYESEGCPLNKQLYGQGREIVVDVPKKASPAPIEAVA